LRGFGTRREVKWKCHESYKNPDRRRDRTVVTIQSYIYERHRQVEKPGGGKQVENCTQSFGQVQSHNSRSRLTVIMLFKIADPAPS
jgi:hypothetical protein